MSTLGRCVGVAEVLLQLGLWAEEGWCGRSLRVASAACLLRVWCMRYEEAQRKSLSFVGNFVHSICHFRRLFSHLHPPSLIHSARHCFSCHTSTGENGNTGYTLRLTKVHLKVRIRARLLTQQSPSVTLSKIFLLPRSCMIFSSSIQLETDGKSAATSVGPGRWFHCLEQRFLNTGHHLCTIEKPL